ncbi:MAG TPA: multidrug effflux MFS transporter [Opitutaceae bacterium]|nr:multidrug effflux MFS transporter [Opitutaceae bacterium]HPG18361.1 multidrug effflux MFS transporter [Opitutaceae bacterium]HPO01357.1 multidrug effflux MFS transporter [Opitutaceae bacterium]
MPDSVAELSATAIAAPTPAAPQHDWRVLAILSALMGFASISTDLYLPAMPAIGEALGASGGTIEFTVSGYLIGFSLGQLFWGPLGDRRGRRGPIAAGLVLFAIGSAGCALAGTAYALIAWRIVQALGASAGVVLSRAMVRDLYAGNRAAQMLSTLIVVMAVAPLLGPTVGGQILRLASWRAIFWTLVGVGLATLGPLLTLPETLPARHRNRTPLAGAFADYLPLLRNRRVMACAGAGGFYMSGMFAYVAGTPFAYIHYYHVRPQLYGLLFAAGIGGIMIANLANARLVRRFGSVRLLLAGAFGAAASGLAVAAVARTGAGGLAGLVATLLLFASMAGLIVANSLAEALAAEPEHAGTVSALVGALQYGSGILGSALVGGLADGTPWPLGAVIALSGLGAAACAWPLRKTIAPTMIPGAATPA